MIPEGWRNTSLDAVTDSVASIRYGVVQIGPHTPDGVPIVAIKFINRIASAPLHRASNAIEAPYKNSRVQGGDVLLSVKGTVGEVGVVPPGFKGNIAREIARIRPRENVQADYLAYQLQAPETQGRIKAVTVGSTRLEFSISAVKKFEILLPPLPEQRRIAEILATWDRAIETVEALIANARAQKKALMQSLLTGKHRLPGFSGEWKSIELKSMGKTSSGGTPDSDNDDYWNGNILWTTPTDITALNRKYITDTKRKISATGLANCSAKLLPAGTLLICTRATIGDMAIAKSPISTNQGFKNLTPNASFVSEFLFHLFGFHKHIFIRYACGSTFLELSKFDFEKRKFLVPGRPEQQAIANILDDADLEIESFEAEAQTLRQEKSALMQQLLTGKRRVKLTES